MLRRTADHLSKMAQEACKLRTSRTTTLLGFAPGAIRVVNLTYQHQPMRVSTKVRILRGNELVQRIDLTRLRGDLLWMTPRIEYVNHKVSSSQQGNFAPNWGIHQDDAYMFRFALFPPAAVEELLLESFQLPHRLQLQARLVHLVRVRQHFIPHCRRVTSRK